MLSTSPELQLPQKGEYGKAMGLDKLISSLILELRVVNACHAVWSGCDLSHMCEDLLSPHQY